MKDFDLWLPASRQPVAELCREFGISRKTGYKIFDRYPVTQVSGRTRILREFLVGFELPTKGL